MVSSGILISLCIIFIFSLGRVSSEVERFVRKRVTTVDAATIRQDKELQDETFFGREIEYYAWDLSMSFSMSYSMSFDFTGSPSEHQVDYPTGLPIVQPSMIPTYVLTDAPTNVGVTDKPTPSATNSNHPTDPMLPPTQAPTEFKVSGSPHPTPNPSREVSNDSNSPGTLSPFPSSNSTSAPNNLNSISPSSYSTGAPSFFNNTLSNETGVGSTNSSVIVDKTVGSINSLDRNTETSGNAWQHVVLPLAVSGGLVLVGLGLFARRNPQGPPEYLDLSQRSSVISIPNEEDL